MLNVVLGKLGSAKRSEVLELGAIIVDGGHFAGGDNGDHGVLGRESRVEVAHVEHVLGERGPYGRLDAAVEDLLVVEFGEPGVGEDFLEAAARPESVGGVFLEQLEQKTGEAMGGGDLPA